MTLSKLAAALAVVSAVALGLVALVWLQSAHCEEWAHLDRVLGGGAPVCFGASMASLESFGATRGKPDDSSPVSAQLVRGGVTYDYTFEAPFAPFAEQLMLRVDGACATGPDSASVDAIVTRAQAMLGGRWRRTQPAGNPNFLWEGSTGAWISTDARTFVCFSPRGGAG